VNILKTHYMCEVGRSWGTLGRISYTILNIVRARLGRKTDHFYFILGDATIKNTNNNILHNSILNLPCIIRAKRDLQWCRLTVSRNPQPESKHYYRLGGRKRFFTDVISNASVRFFTTYRGCLSRFYRELISPYSNKSTVAAIAFSRWTFHGIHVP